MAKTKLVSPRSLRVYLTDGTDDLAPVYKMEAHQRRRQQLRKRQPRLVAA